MANRKLNPHALERRPPLLSCGVCRQPGHWKDECPRLKSVPPLPKDPPPEEEVKDLGEDQEVKAASEQREQGAVSQQQEQLRQQQEALVSLQQQLAALEQQRAAALAQQREEQLRLAALERQQQQQQLLALQQQQQQQQQQTSLHHFCAPCGVGFLEQLQLDEHLAKHVVCVVPDCGFAAKKKIVQAHALAVHGLDQDASSVEKPVKSHASAAHDHEQVVSEPTPSFIGTVKRHAASAHGNGNEEQASPDNSLAVRSSASQPPNASVGQQQQSLVCRPCSITFVEQILFDSHMRSHRMCGEPGCGYFGVRKVVKAHAKTAHGHVVMFSQCSVLECDFFGSKSVVREHEKTVHGMPPKPVVRGLEDLERKAIELALGDKVTYTGAIECSASPVTACQVPDADAVASNREQATSDRSSALNTVGPPRTVDKMLLESKPVRCEACDRNFSDKRDLEVHVLAHVTCREPDCAFSASKLVVMEHFEKKHQQYSLNTFKSFRKQEPEAEEDDKHPTPEGQLSTVDEEAAVPAPDCDPAPLNLDISIEEMFGTFFSNTNTTTPANASKKDKKWYCVPCKESFASDAESKAHVSTHVECLDSSCKFSASKEIVATHFVTAHAQTINAAQQSTATHPSNSTQPRQQQQQSPTQPQARPPATSAPPAGYSCKLCGSSSHWIYYCSRALKPSTPLAHLQHQQQQNATLRAQSHHQLPRSPSQSSTARGPTPTASTTVPRQSAAPKPDATKTFWRCEPCDVQFIRESQLQQHLGQHQVCSHPGCSYSATGRKVTEHAAAVHGAKESGQVAGSWRCEPCNTDFAFAYHLRGHILQHVTCPVDGCNFSAVKRVLKGHALTAHGHTLPNSATKAAAAVAVAATPASGDDGSNILVMDGKRFRLQEIEVGGQKCSVLMEVPAAEAAVVQQSTSQSADGNQRAQQQQPLMPREARAESTPSSQSNQLIAPPSGSKPAVASLSDPPPPAYRCNICRMPGHWSQVCSLRGTAVGKMVLRAHALPQENAPRTSQRAASALSSTTRTIGPPPEHYICHACRVPGHWIEDCALYQGGQRKSTKQQPRLDKGPTPPGASSVMAQEPTVMGDPRIAMQHQQQNQQILSQFQQAQQLHPQYQQQQPQQVLYQQPPPYPPASYQQPPLPPASTVFVPMPPPQRVVYVHQVQQSARSSMPPPSYCCDRCRVPGHWVRDCQKNTVPPPNYLCHRCGESGHWVQACPYFAAAHHSGSARTTMSVRSD